MNPLQKRQLRRQKIEVLTALLSSKRYVYRTIDRLSRAIGEEDHTKTRVLLFSIGAGQLIRAEDNVELWAFINRAVTAEEASKGEEG